MEDDDPTTAYRLRYSIQYPSLHADVNWQAGKHKLTFGLATTYYSVKPAALDPEGGRVVCHDVSPYGRAVLGEGFYIGDGYELSDKLLLDVGVRLSAFTALGAADVYQYGPAGRNVNTITDTVHYASGKAIKTYTGSRATRIAAIYSYTNRIYKSRVRSYLSIPASYLQLGSYFAYRRVAAQQCILLATGRRPGVAGSVQKPG